MANYHLNKTILADIPKNSDVVDKSINKPILTCFNKKQCHCQHSVNDTSENMFLNSSSIIHQHGSASGTSEVQLVNSPTRSSRRCLSNTFEDGDFQNVSYKKKIYHQNSSTIRLQVFHHHNY
ncbi:unnamed protein product [Adineta steineri]|nr:unnamed protein product [Adineta steineri]